MTNRSLSRRRVLHGTAALAASTLVGSTAHAQTYPAKELNWIVYHPPGGSLDVSTRIIAPYLEAQGFKSVIDYVTGAGGRIARTKLFNSPPDGYTLLTQVAPGSVVDQMLYQVPYKVTDFEPLYGWASPGYQLCVKKDSPMRTFEDLLHECRKRRVTIASLGRSGSPHIQLLIMRKELDMPFDIVHFDGSSPAYTAVAGGHVDACLGGPGSGARMADRLHFVAMLGTKREEVIADVPTLDEQGFKCTLLRQIFYAEAPPRVPADRIAKLAAAFANAFEDPELSKRLSGSGEYVTKVPREEIQEANKVHLAVITQYRDLLTK